MSEPLSSPAEFLREILDKISKSHNIDFEALISFLYVLDSSERADVDFEIGNIKINFRKWLEPLKMRVEKTKEGVKFSTEILVPKYLPEVIEKYITEKKKGQQ